jgi:capsid assembly protease
MSILRAVCDQVWAIRPEKLLALVEVAERHDRGGALSASEITAAIGPGPQAADVPRQSSATIAVLPLYGTIFPRANMVTEQSGGVSLAMWAKTFRRAAADPTLSAIVLDIDSPGGAVALVPEVAAEIRAARDGRRPIVAVSDTVMGSAAVYLGSAADELVASPSSETGSIGVYYVHMDQSEALAKEGVKARILSAGEGKTDLHPLSPLTDEAAARMQARVDEFYAMFVRDVAAGRGVSTEMVRKNWKALVYGAKEAVAIGMADRVATLEETLARLASPSGRRASLKGLAADDGEADRRLRRLRADL